MEGVKVKVYLVEIKEMGEICTGIFYYSTEFGWQLYEYTDSVYKKQPQNTYDTLDQFKEEFGGDFNDYALVTYLGTL